MLRKHLVPDARVGFGSIFSGNGRLSEFRISQFLCVCVVYAYLMKW